MFCIPGTRFSYHFLHSWTNLYIWCKNNNIEPVLHQATDPDIYVARNRCLGAEFLDSPQRKPFNGERYDYIMWIDSDQTFQPEDFAKLLSRKKKIVSGLYLLQSKPMYACVEHWDEEIYRKYGGFQQLTPESIKGKKELISVAYNGLGFCLMQQGVLESIQYPWFPYLRIPIADHKHTLPEDVGLFYRLRKAGFTIYADPTVLVGHEKLNHIGDTFNPPSKRCYLTDKY